ncbi:PEP-CTERM sorting domain-containing protein [Bremerella cremea]|uniref:PEP-CTERM sorting domain-containing protein n=1 Tax=Bremerella cremea TaxID=1031537 RepID=A0A368KT28_9BACT|nr:PEP-CTERM sorting domain-containing protein [Bremerella cremea]RCS52713.1 PEP-CTERM sorting domain-containing protein [Bremerella cremea]
MKLLPKTLLALLLLGCLGSVSQADMLSSNVFFGSGNSNQYFTVSQAGGVEIGMRAKLRYDPNDGNQPKNFDQSSDLGYAIEEGSYYFSTPNYGTDRAIWNLDWSVNSDFNQGTPASTTNKLSAFTYNINFDFDPAGAGSNSSTNYNPVNELYNDNSYGNKTTTSANDVTPGPLVFGFIPTAPFASDLNDDYTITQNSTNVGFSGLLPGTVTQNGIYTITFSVLDGLIPIATNQIKVYAGVNPPAAVPEPASMALFGMGVVGLIGGGAARKRLKQKREAANSNEG